jgi:superoxide dismutase, Fe-Mn family
MPFSLPPLPYSHDALQPYMSKETLEYHHDKHHAAYVNKLNELTANKPEADKTLEQVILASDGPVFNNAAQVWNHTFFWNCLTPKSGGEPTGELADAIKRDFGSFADFKKQFTEAAVGQFGSGWAWLVQDGGKLSVMKTSNADLPLKHNKAALLTVDVWEHAYYIDYRNLRPKFVEAFFSIVNWDFVAQNLKSPGSFKP